MNTLTPRSNVFPYTTLFRSLALAGCKGSGDGVIALEGATLIDGSGRAPVTDAVILVKDGHIQAVAQVNEIPVPRGALRSEEHTSELQSHSDLVCRLLIEKKK